MNKNFIVALLFAAPLSQALAYTENANDQISFLDKPYTVTHLSKFKLDCVWTKDEQGRIQSEAMGPDGPGACWSQSSVDQVQKLNKEGKLVWHKPKNEPEITQVNINGYIATKDNIIGSVALACYAGSMNRSQNKDRVMMYLKLIDLHKGDAYSLKRISRAYDLARSNMADRIIGDNMGYQKVKICDQMVIDGYL